MESNTLTTLRSQEKLLLRHMKDYARALARVRKLIKLEQKALHRAKLESGNEDDNT